MTHQNQYEADDNGKSLKYIETSTQNSVPVKTSFKKGEIKTFRQKKNHNHPLPAELQNKNSTGKQGIRQTQINLYEILEKKQILSIMTESRLVVASSQR